VTAVPDQALRVAALISGRGSNLQSIIDACAGDLPARVVVVISNRPDAPGLQRARQAGIPTRVLDHRRFQDRISFDRALQELLDAFEPGLVVLAGFMRVLSDTFTGHYAGRLLNIHPSLLPRHRGLHTHQRALEAGDVIHGASVHFVTSELDGGPVILQAQVPVHGDDTAESLAARVLEKEHVIYPLAIRWHAQGRLALRDGKVYLDGRALSRPIQLEEILAAERHGQHAQHKAS
jgi:phosphoribosylglycinamide formyltransferase-1